MLQRLNTTSVTATELKPGLIKILLSNLQKSVMTGWLVDDNDNAKALHSYLTRKMNLVFIVDVSFGGHMLLFHLRDVR